MKLKVVTDVHCGSSYELFNYNRLLWELSHVPKDHVLIYMGDNIDLKNVRRREVPAWRERLAYCQSLVEHEGGEFLFGNHELEVHTPRHVKIGSIYLSHGDWEMWGEEKSLAYRGKEAGAGWLKRTFFSPALEEARDIWGAHINARFEDALLSISARHPEVKHYVCGHKHPRLTMSGVLSGISYKVLPRGVSFLELG